MSSPRAVAVHLHAASLGLLLPLFVVVSSPLTATTTLATANAPPITPNLTSTDTTPITPNLTTARTTPITPNLATTTTTPVTPNLAPNTPLRTTTLASPTLRSTLSTTLTTTTLGTTALTTTAAGTTTTTTTAPLPGNEFGLVSPKVGDGANDGSMARQPEGEGCEKDKGLHCVLGRVEDVCECQRCV